MMMMMMMIMMNLLMNQLLSVSATSLTQATSSWARWALAFLVVCHVMLLLLVFFITMYSVYGEINIMTMMIQSSHIPERTRSKETDVPVVLKYRMWRNLIWGVGGRSKGEWFSEPLCNLIAWSTDLQTAAQADSSAISTPLAAVAGWPAAANACMEEGKRSHEASL